MIVTAGLVLGIAATTAAALPSVAAESDPGIEEASAQTHSTAAAQKISAPVAVVAAGVDTALADAHEARTAAAKATLEVMVSGLDVGTADTTVDTSELTGLIGQLQTADLTPTLLLPPVIAETSDETVAVLAEASALREALADAKQRAAEEAARKAAAEKAAKEKAAKEAAEKAAKEAAEKKAAEEAAAAAAEEAASIPDVDIDVDPDSAKGIAKTMAAEKYGWGDDEFACLVALWKKESGWRVNAASSSGAYGIPQALPGSKMASAGDDWETNPATQIKWGLKYINGRYGSPCEAWEHSESSGWY
ncbi:MAG: transglycosylase SLT domain-containing protein [Microbacterium sp.]